MAADDKAPHKARITLEAFDERAIDAAVEALQRHIIAQGLRIEGKVVYESAGPIETLIARVEDLTVDGKVKWELPLGITKAAFTKAPSNAVTDAAAALRRTGAKISVIRGGTPMDTLWRDDDAAASGT